MSVGFKEFVGPYRMFHLIRAGALFEIWAVRPVAETTAFAMKWLPPGRSYDRANVANLKHEYEVGKTLDHPSIIKTYDFGTGKDGAYLVMELFKTPNLKQQTHRQHRDAPLAARQDSHRVRRSRSTTCTSKGWVHRDIKPDNFLVDDENHIRLIDFNLTRKIKKGLGKLLSNKMPVQGTYSYMAPEQIRGQAVDERADIYSFGCMVLRADHRQAAVHGDQPGGAAQQAPQDEAARTSACSTRTCTPTSPTWCTRMLAKEPKDRPESLKEFIRTLKAGRVFQIKPRKPQPKTETKDEDD